MDRQAVFILGAGGHAKVLLDTLTLHKNINIIGILDKNPQLHGMSVLGIPVLGDEAEILNQYSPDEIYLINAVGSIASTTVRKNIYLKFKQAGFSFLRVIHPTAYLAQEVSLGEGVQIITRSTIQPGSRIGNNTIINTHASIDHDCDIGDHVHIAPGVVCCGGVKIGHGTHIGTGAVILQGVRIGDNCLIGAGAVVTRDVLETSKVAGVPARIME